MTALQALDYLGIAVFAATGALAASRRQLDIVAFIFFATVTGIGGGTLRDLLLGLTPVFWIVQPAYLAIPVVVAVCVFFTAHLAESRYRVLLWADAAGLASYAVVGAAKALEAGASALAAVLLGMMTASAGGIVRDVLAGEPSVLLREEIYQTAAAVGAGLFVLLFHTIGVPFWPAAAAGSALAFMVRAGALLFGWRLVAYRSRPGRDAAQVKIR